MRLQRLALLAPLFGSTLFAQSASPIPDVPTLVREVESHQHQMDQVRENYTYRESMLEQDLDKKGNVKKTENNEFEVFYVNAHEIQRKVRKNGKDLDASEQKKEQDRVNKEVDKAIKTPPGEAMDKNTVSVTRLLSIMKVSNPRRVSLHGRDAIAFDFTGDPHAKTHGVSEDVSKKLAGTLWIDEKDRQVARMEARFNDNFHLGFGLMSVDKGSTFTFEQALVNNELWLPTSAQIHIVAHAVAIIGFRADIHVTDSDYKKFHAEATQQPGATVVK